MAEQSNKERSPVPAEASAPAGVSAAPVDARTRERAGAIAGAVGMGCNVLLFAVKLLVGTAANSIAITADAFNNLSDAGSSLVTAVGFRMSGKPADREHPFGHGRIEYISGLIVAFAILLVGFELFTSSVKKIFHPDALQSGPAAIAVLLGSIAVKLFMGLFYRRVGRRIQSTALMAAMTDSISDMAATAAVVLSVAVHLIWGVNIDGIMGAIVAVLIFVAGIKTVSDTLSPLLGQAPDPALVRQIRDMVLSYDGILGIHDMLVHNYGPGRFLASLHAEVDANRTLTDTHELIDRIERDIHERLGVLTVIHMDPVQHDTPRVCELRALTEEVLRELDPRLSFHDFRIVDGATRTNVIFDVVVPYRFPMNEAELNEALNKAFRARDPQLCAVVTMDTSFTGDSDNLK